MLYMNLKDSESQIQWTEIICYIKVFCHCYPYLKHLSDKNFSLYEGFPILVFLSCAINNPPNSHFTALASDSFQTSLSWQQGGNEGRGKKNCYNETTKNNFCKSDELKFLFNGSASGLWPHLNPIGKNWSRNCPWQKNINDWLHLLEVHSSFLCSKIIL